MQPRSQRAQHSLSLLVRNAVCLVLASCLFSPTFPAFAADDDEASLAKAETILFGEPSREGDIADRLGRAEKRIFGRHKTGTDEERIERITSTLLIERQALKTAIKTEKTDSGETQTAGQTKPVKTPGNSTEALTDTQANAEPVAEASPEPAKLVPQTVAKAAGPEADKNKGKGKGRKAGKKSGKNVHKTAVTQQSNTQAGVGKVPEVKLTPETASLDSRKEERPHPSALDMPVNGTNSNRISRGASPKANQAVALLREGMDAHRKGEYDRAEQLFKKVVLLEPRNPDGYFNLGALAEKKNDLAGALMSYRAALNLSPDDRELKEAVESVEGMLGVEPAGNHRVAGAQSAEARSSEIRDFYSQDAAKVDTPAPAPNFYRARAKTTRELQEEAAPYADVTEPNPPELSVSPPPTPVANTSQPQPFQLQTAQNQNNVRTHGGAGMATRAILGVALSVGTRYALRSSGLHCPICRIGGGGGALRGLLRF